MGAFPGHQVLHYVSALLSFCLVAGGCSMLSRGSAVHHSARGAVVLQEVADWSFEASHPAVLDQATMLKIIKGVVAEEATKGLQNVPASGSKPMRMFSDDDAEFLAPLLAQALSQAKPEQLVGFTVSSSAGSGNEPAAGTLYVQQGNIYLTITSPPSKKPAGFTPGSAARTERAAPYARAGTPDALSLVIDQQALSRAPMPAVPPVAAEPTGAPMAAPPAAATGKALSKADNPGTVPTQAVSLPEPGGSAPSQLSNDELLNRKLDELRQARESNKMKESEIALLKKEIAWLKQELRERTAEVKAMRAHRASRPSTSKGKTAEVRPRH